MLITTPYVLIKRKRRRKRRVKKEKGTEKIGGVKGEGRGTHVPFLN